MVKKAGRAAPKKGVLSRVDIYRVKRIVEEWFNILRHKKIYYVQLINGDFTVATYMEGRRILADDTWGLYSKKEKRELDRRWQEEKIRDNELAVRKGLL